MLAHWIAFYKAVGLVFWTIAMLIWQVICRTLHFPARHKNPHRWHRGVCRIVGARLEVEGKVSKQKPTLFVANHASYLDIVVLGASLKGSFVSKAEVAHWPVFGFLAKLQNTIFIERRAGQTRQQQNELTGRLTQGDNLILFPEGTSGSGHRILPFKSTLFSVAAMIPAEQELIVQPVTIQYQKLDGMPVTRVLRPYFAWYGDMALGKHLWQVLGLGKITVKVLLHEPVKASAFANRKELAAYCQQQVEMGLYDASHQYSPFFATRKKRRFLAALPVKRVKE